MCRDEMRVCHRRRKKCAVCFICSLTEARNLHSLYHLHHPLTLISTFPKPARCPPQQWNLSAPLEHMHNPEVKSERETERVLRGWIWFFLCCCHIRHKKSLHFDEFFRIWVFYIFLRFCIFSKCILILCMTTCFPQKQGKTTVDIFTVHEVGCTFI